MFAQRAGRRPAWRWCLMIGLLCCFGCRPALESSDSAVSLPLLDRDPAEDGLAANRWPGWRGPNGQGIAPGGSPAVEFSGSDGYRWKVPVPGDGSSSPVVWDDAVFLSSALESTDLPMLVVLCYDRRDGSLRWQMEAGEAIGRTHNKNGYASASVATDGERIFAFFGRTGLFCYDFDGDRQWGKDLGYLDHQYGTAASPVLFEDSVIQVCDSAKDSYIAAFAKADGKRLWKTKRPSSGCWSTPAFVDVQVDGVARTEMIVNGTASGDAAGRMVIGYDPRNGDELWRVQGTTRLVTPTPIISNGLVYSLSGRNGTIMAIRPGGQGDVTDTHVVWKRRRGGPYTPSGVAYRNRLFAVGDGGRLACYNAGSGEKIWTTRLRGPVTSSLVAADGRIYGISEKGTAFVFAAADDYRQLAANDMQSRRCLATPAVAGGELFIRTATDLYCIPGGSTQRRPSGTGSGSPGLAPTPEDPDEGPSPGDPPPVNEAVQEQAPTDETADEAVKPAVAASKDAWPLFRGDSNAVGVARTTLPEKLERLWTFSVDDGGFESTAVIANGTVFTDCTDGKLYAIDLATGKKRWEYTTELGFVASMEVHNGLAAVRGGAVYIGDVDGQFFCIDAKTGKPRWQYRTEAEINSSPNFHADNVLFSSQDENIYCLNAATGKLVWKHQIEDLIQSSVTVSGNHGFANGCNGQLHVIDLVRGRGVRDVDLRDPTICTPAVAGSTAFVGTTGYRVFAVDWKKSKTLWEYESPERGDEFRSSPAVTDEMVIIGCRDELLHAIDRKTGKGLWTFPTKDWIEGSPVVVGDRVFFGSGAGRLYSLDLKTGNPLWEFQAGGMITGSPAVAAGRLVIGTDEGDLYCFGAKEE